MTKINLKNIVWKEGKHFVAQCLNVDVSSFGKNKSEALANLHEALALYFDGKTKIKLTDVKNPELIDLMFKHA